MTDNQLHNTLEKYIEIDNFEKEFRESKERQIKEIEAIIDNSYHRDIYKELYKEEYGDFREFREKLAKELRDINR